MTDEERRTPIIITDKPDATFYKSILLEGMRYDNSILHWTDKNAANAEYIIRMMTKGAGWTIVRSSRRRVQTENTVCKWKDPATGMCTNPQVQPTVKCTEQVRRACASYEQKQKGKFEVNEIIMEKVAQARGI